MYRSNKASAGMDEQHQMRRTSRPSPSPAAPALAAVTVVLVATASIIMTAGVEAFVVPRDRSALLAQPDRPLTRARIHGGGGVARMRTCGTASTTCNSISALGAVKTTDKAKNTDININIGTDVADLTEYDVLPADVPSSAVVATNGTDDDDKSIGFESSTSTLLVTSPELAIKLESQSEEAAAEAKAEAEANPLSGLLWRLVVVTLCALWASNFAAAKLILAEPGVDSSLYAVSRFGVAALALLPGSVRLIAKERGLVDRETALAALQCGGWVAFGYLGQTLGLLTTTASRSCVICSLHCVFVAIIAELLRVRRARDAGAIDGSDAATFDLKRLIPAVVAVTGVAIVELTGAAGGPNVGDALSIAQPIGFGMGYLQLEELMARNPAAALPVSAIKLGVVATASLCMFELSPLIHSADYAGGISEALTHLSLQFPNFGAILSSPLAVGGILYTGLVTTAAALWVESIAFARVPATDASIILTTEPIFAAAAGAVTLGETFGISDYVGASLIISACVLSVFLDVPGDAKCEVGSDGALVGECEPPKQWPMGGN
mmetsp:Transcript_20046/g.43201  ORF Transcript_20046/g.43201 Transcript_20046/m.43201 type:complete len:552 (+) Transcript_20046:95-1750(+)